MKMEDLTPTSYWYEFYSLVLRACLCLVVIAVD